MNDRNFETTATSTPRKADQPAAAAYAKPEFVGLGRIETIQASSRGSTYDGLYTTRSWWYR